MQKKMFAQIDGSSILIEESGESSSEKEEIISEEKETD